MKQEPVGELIHLVERGLGQAKVRLELETEKRRALLQSDVNAIGALLPQLQAEIMRFAQLEQKRLGLLQGQGLHTLNAKELLARYQQGSPEQLRLEGVLGELRTVAMEIQARNQESLKLARGYMTLLSQLLPPDLSAIKPTYGAKGAESRSGAGFTQTI